MTLRNFTPHPLRLEGVAPVPGCGPGWADDHDSACPAGRGEGGPCLGTVPVVELAPAGPAPRLVVEREDLGVLAGLPIVRSTMGSPEGLPPPEAGVVFVVSALVAEAAPERDDLAYPGEAIRDAAGRVVAARGLCAGPGLAARLRAARAA